MPPYSGDFTFSENVSNFNVSPAKLLASMPGVGNLLAGTLIFRSAEGSQAGESDGTRDHEVLLIRRSPTDTFPLKWETPVGTADPDDTSILGVAARELWEEAGLQAGVVKDSVGLQLPDGQMELPLVNGTATARKIPGSDLFVLRFADDDEWAAAFFVVELRDPGAKVVLQPAEHVDYAWVTEDEVRDERRAEGGESLDFASEAMKNVLLHGFEKRRNMLGSS